MGNEAKGIAKIYESLPDCDFCGALCPDHAALLFEKIDERVKVGPDTTPPSALLTEEQLTDFEHDCETDIGVELADVVKLLAHIRELQKHLNQTIADDCETDTRCRELLKQWDKSDSYGVEPLEVVIERALKELRQQ